MTVFGARMGASTRRRIGAGLLVAVTIFFVLGPFTAFTTGYRLDTARLAFYLAILTSTWSLLAGVAGQFSFAHVAVAGLAGYSGAIWSRRMFLSEPMLAGVTGSVVFGTLFGLVVATLLALLLNRLRGAYFALFTIAFAEVARLAIIAESDLTGGRLSLSVFPRLPGSSTTHYYAVFGLLLGTLALIYWLLRTRFGLNLHAMREDHQAAAAMGVNVGWLKVRVIAISSLLASFAGAVYFHTTPRMVPENLDLILMSQVIAFAVIGGLEHPLAAAVSAISLTFLMESLRTISLGGPEVAALAVALVAVPAFVLLTAIRRSTPRPGLGSGLKLALPWVVPALAAWTWWLFAPYAAGGGGSPPGWVVALIALGLFGRAVAVVRRTEVPAAARRIATVAVVTAAAAIFGAKMLTLGALFIEVGVWRMAMFGAVLVLTLRFSPNGLLVPVFDYFASREELRRLAVRHREVDAVADDAGEDSPQRGGAPVQPAAVGGARGDAVSGEEA